MQNGMKDTRPTDPHQKALAVNLDQRRYGTFAEIGAGQEVVRWFFRAGGAAVLAWLGRMLASRQQSLMFLQDQLWAQTRGEQRRINRWAVWARLRRQRKEEKA